MSDVRFERAIAAIDAANAEDPTVIDFEGTPQPKELVHAWAMTGWVTKLDPAASDEQLLAARAHHLRRWSIPRDEYPEGRAGYLRWRAALKRLHGEEVACVLADAGYGHNVIGRVQELVRKEGLGVDPAAQVHEDALCLVFLSMQFDDLIARLGADKTVGVVAKTVAKMSAQGQAEALALPLSAVGASVVGRALAG